MSSREYQLLAHLKDLWGKVSIIYFLFWLWHRLCSHIHPDSVSQVNTLQQCMKNMLASFTKHRHIIHAGYTFAGKGSWILQVEISETADSIGHNSLPHPLCSGWDLLFCRLHNCLRRVRRAEGDPLLRELYFHQRALLPGGRVEAGDPSAQLLWRI